MKDGFVKVAAASPDIKVADCVYNTSQIKRVIDSAAARGVAVLVLPELCVTGYTCDDLFTQPLLLTGAEESLFDIAAHTKGKEMLVLLGIPLKHNGLLYNTAAALCDGELLGVVPKTFVPAYGEFYEQRYFACAPSEMQRVVLHGRHYPFGTQLLFRCSSIPELVVAAEICEDFFVAVSPGARHATAGATVLANLSASNELAGKPAFRRKLVEMQSVNNTCGYIYCSAGDTESTTDVVFSAHNIIAENGTLLAESKPFGEGYAESEIDVRRLTAERLRETSVRKSSAHGNYEMIDFCLSVKETALSRTFEPQPFVPDDVQEWAQRCKEIINIQCSGLRKRMEHTGMRKAVIGVSGGLDSTLALLITCRTMQQMGRPMTDVIGVSMPCFGTTARTKSNAQKLCELMGVDFREIDITASVTQHLHDIGHSMDDTDTTFENAQARERTQVLMDVSNMENGLVIGTGNLSELALGWSTYNGDHMSMYAVNCGVPKTLVRHLVWFISDHSGDALKAVLCDVLDTPISPELLPVDGAQIAQRTEDLIGPYELHDFFLYYFVRWGYEPQKIVRVAVIAFAGRYETIEIVKWLKSFLRRFFNNQFKRSCVPNGPKVGSVGLSPRGDWRMPSDASFALWMEQLKIFE